MIVEGLVTSLDRDGRLNVAPMGPIVSGDFEALVLRPFQPSTTFDNLNATRCGVFHVVDRVEVIAAAAIGQLVVQPDHEPARAIVGHVLLDCCRWFEFTVDSVDASAARSVMPATIVHRGERRPFLGFNRARHAVLEAAILATRVHLLSQAVIDATLEMLAAPIHKTGEAEELAAFELLVREIRNRQNSAR